MLQCNERSFFYLASSTKTKNLTSNPLLIFRTSCIYPSMSFISDSTISFCWSFACCCFLSLFSCKWPSCLCQVFLTCCNILLDMFREWDDKLPENRWSLIKQRDWIVNSSIFLSRRFLFRQNPLSTEASPWLVEKITCKIMYSSLSKETPVNFLKKKSSNICFFCLRAWIFSGPVNKQVWMKDEN